MEYGEAHYRHARWLPIRELTMHLQGWMHIVVVPVQAAQLVFSDVL